MDYKDFCLTCLVTFAAINTVLNGARNDGDEHSDQPGTSQQKNGNEASCSSLKLPELLPVCPTRSLQGNSSPQGCCDNQKQKESCHSCMGHAHSVRLTIA